MGLREGKADVATYGIVPSLGDPRERRSYIANRRLVGAREGRGEVPTFDFVPLFGDPLERRGCIAIPPTCGPLRRQG